MIFVSGQELVERHASDANVRLGELLYKRKIKPGAVITEWSRSRGSHAEEVRRRSEVVY